jgi:hypothetical protein
MDWARIAELAAYLVAGSSVLSAILPRPADPSSPLGRARGAVDVLAVNIGRAKPDGVTVIDRQGKDRRQR